MGSSLLALSCPAYVHQKRERSPSPSEPVSWVSCGEDGQGGAQGRVHSSERQIKGPEKTELPPGHSFRPGKTEVPPTGLSPSNHSQPPAQPRARDNPSSAPRGKQEGRIRFDGFVLQVLLSFPNPLSKRSWIFRQGEAWAGSVRKTRLGLFLFFFFF